jgi:DNA-binding CsgD family transcriptional regulator
MTPRHSTIYDLTNLRATPLSESPTTVADHLKTIYGKVGVSSGGALAAALSGTAGNPTP